MKMACLAFTNYEEKLCGILHSLADNREFSDVTLACEGKYVLSHKIILSAMSPILSSLLKENPHEHPIIFLTGVKYSQMVHLLEFIYKGQVNIPRDHVEDFLEVTKDMQIEEFYLKEEEEKDGDLTKRTDYEIEDNKLLEIDIKMEPNDCSTDPLDEECYIAKENQRIQKDHITDIIYEQNIIPELSLNKSTFGTCPSVENHKDNFPKTKKKKMKNKNKFLDSFLHFPCDICGKIFARRDHLKDHKDVIHGEIRYSCELCDYQATKKYHLKRHVDSVHERIRHQCNLCDYKASQKTDLNRHIKQQHSRVVSDLIKPYELVETDSLKLTNFTLNKMI